MQKVGGLRKGDSLGREPLCLGLAGLQYLGKKGFGKQNAEGAKKPKGRRKGSRLVVILATVGG